jgi:hypothetical protein
MPHLEVPHFSKLTWAVLLGGAVALGLYLRHRASATGKDNSGLASSSSDLPNLPDSVSPYDTISGTDTTGTGNGSFPYPAGGPGQPIRIIIKEPREKHPIRHPKPKKKPTVASRHRKGVGSKAN